MENFEVEVVSAALVTAEGKYGDDHNGKSETVSLALEYIDPEGWIYLIPTWEASISINPLYVNEAGEVHLSTLAVGGLLAEGGVDLTSLRRRASAYNKAAKNRDGDTREKFSRVFDIQSGKWHRV